MKKLLLHKIIILIISVYLCQNIYGQRPLEPIQNDNDFYSFKMNFISTNDNTNRVNWHQMITNVPRDISTFPQVAFSSEQLPLFASLIAGTGLLMTIDHSAWEVNKRLYDNSQVFHELSDIGVSLGDEKYHLMLAGVFTIYGLLNDNKRAIKTASNVVEAIIASGISVQLLKRVFGRESPAAATKNAGNWKFFPNLKEYQNNQTKYYAYPSGHITTLTASVTVIANNFPEQKWIKPVGYSLIVLSGIGLVSRDMHWYSDLPLGFFLGYTFGNLISPKVNENKYEDVNKKINYTLTPLIGRDLGLSFTLNF